MAAEPNDVAPSAADNLSDPLEVALVSVESSVQRLLHDVAGARHRAALIEAFELKDRLVDLRAAVADAPRLTARRAGERP